MRRALVLAGLLAVLVCCAPASAAPSGDAYTACAQADKRLGTMCYGADVAVRDGKATCRRAGGPCQPEADVSGWDRTWAHRALSLQYALGNDLGLRDAPWVGTHNSFNSIAEMGNTVSDADANQQLSLPDQLAIDVRSIEIDMHSWLGGQVVCHARGADQRHAGCSAEKAVGPVVDEIAGWLRAHPRQVLLLYIEDNLDGPADHDAAAAAVKHSLGSLLYPPPAAAGDCRDNLPLTLSRDDVLRAGRQVVIVSGCGEGAAWRSLAFDWSAHEENRPVGYTDLPKCGDYTRATYDAKLIRYYEDSTWLTAGASNFGQSSVDDGITPATAAKMMRCGVDLIGLDQLLPGDGRLDALVWSWAPGQPAAKGGDCAVALASGRWEVSPCGDGDAVACRDAAGA